MDQGTTRELALYPATGRFLMGRVRAELSADEREVLENAVSEVRTVAAGTRLIARGDTCRQSTLLVEGLMLRTLDAEDGRHAASSHVAGDFVDLHCFPLHRLDHNLDTIGPARTAVVPHDRLLRIMDEHPHLSRLLWFQTMLDAALHREWIMRLEQHKAPQRLAHRFAELWRRLDMVGLARRDGFDTSLTQADLAGMCGISAIRVNRALAMLRDDGIAEFRRGAVRIADRARLERYCDFDAAYLYGTDTDLSVE